MSQTLEHKIALVTGGSRGIGRAVALKLAGAGCDVAIVYHNSHEEAEAVCGSIRGLGRRALAIQADVSDPASVAEAFAAFRQQFDQVDIVVSNAAIGVLRPALELTLKHWRRCLETNALALNLLAQQAVPLMPAAGASSRSPASAPGAPFRITPSSAPPRRPWKPWPAAWRRNSARGESASTWSAPGWWIRTP